MIDYIYPERFHLSHDGYQAGRVKTGMCLLWGEHFSVVPSKCGTDIWREISMEKNLSLCDGLTQWNAMTLKQN